MAEQNGNGNGNGFVREFLNIRERIEKLSIPPSSFSAIYQSPDGHVYISESGSREQWHVITPKDPGSAHDKIIAWFKEREQNGHKKFIATALVNGKNPETLSSRLWLEADILAYIETLDEITTHSLKELSDKTSTRFKEEVVPEIYIGEHNKVVTHPLIDAKTYREHVDPHSWQQLEEEVEAFKGKSLLFISATPQGGGVALMRHALIRLYEQLGVDATWCVMQEDKDVFLITKTKFHNVLQGVAAKSTVLTAEDKEQYIAWTQSNVQAIHEEIARADVVVIDDPQPSGMIPHIQEINPDAKLMYRSHIQVRADLVNQADTPQNDVWDFIWRNVQKCDLFISHPIAAFVPDVVPPHKTLYMPPTTDPLDGLNKPLSNWHMQYYMSIFARILIENHQTPLDLNRPYIAQVARFDPSKGIPDTISAFNALREKLVADGWSKLPQLVIVGNGSIDDPDGTPIYNLTMELLQSEKYKHLAGDVKVARLPHIDQLLNTILRKSHVTLQLSHREGYEVKVTEALMKSKPLISYNAGGIPLQIQDEVNGFVVPDVGDAHGVADKLYELFANEDLYTNMSTAASEHAHKDVLTVPNAINWLFLANQLLAHETIDVFEDGFVKNIKDLHTGLKTQPER